MLPEPLGKVAKPERAWNYRAWCGANRGTPTQLCGSTQSRFRGGLLWSDIRTTAGQ